MQRWRGRGACFTESWLVVTTVNKNIITAIKCWPATVLSWEGTVTNHHAGRANPNKSFAVLTLRASRYLSDRGSIVATTASRAVPRAFLPRDAMHKRGLCRHAVSVRLFVTFVDHVKTNKHIFEIFSPSGSHTILVFPCRTGWRYSDGNPLTGASNASGV